MSIESRFTRELAVASLWVTKMTVLSSLFGLTEGQLLYLIDRDAYEGELVAVEINGNLTLAICRDHAVELQNGALTRIYRYRGVLTDPATLTPIRPALDQKPKRQRRKAPRRSEAIDEFPQKYFYV